MTNDDFLFQAAVRITSSLDIEQGLKELVKLFQGTIPADSISLHVIDRSCGLMRVLARADLHSALRLDQLVTLDEAALASVEWGRRPKVRFINDTRQDPMARALAEQTALFDHMGDCSHIVLRFSIDGDMMGEVALQVDGEGQYTPDHALLFQALASPLSSSLFNYLRHQELRRMKRRLEDDNAFLSRELNEHLDQQIIGKESGLREVMDKVRKVAPMDTTVLLLGETGVGKEVIASAIQRLSNRNEGPFIRVNCGSIPSELIDSELFGHEKGAFTGALKARRGRFERAHDGTIFLDEVGELPPQAQVRLLRVLQEREIERVGGEIPVPVNIRVIAATNRDINAMAGKGDFREDLLYRLSVFPIHIPPLRVRKQDIPALLDSFVRRLMREFGYDNAPPMGRRAWERLKNYDWPGNVRELQNLVERELILCRDGGIMEFESLSGDGKPAREPLPGPPQAMLTESRFPSLDKVIIEHIKRALALSTGKIQGAGGAADLLDINPNTLRKRMKKMGIEFGKRRHT